MELRYAAPRETMVKQLLKLVSYMRAVGRQQGSNCHPQRPKPFIVFPECLIGNDGKGLRYLVFRLLPADRLPDFA